LEALRSSQSKMLRFLFILLQLRIPAIVCCCAELGEQAEPVHMVDCSAFQRNVFATCGIDGSVQIYNALQGSKARPCTPRPSRCQDSTEAKKGLNRGVALGDRT